MKLIKYFIFFYYMAWTLVITLCLPIIPLIRKKRIFERLALRLPSTLLDDGNIWIHALSVGEVLSAIPLVKALSNKYPYSDIVFSVTTSTGMAIARAELEGKVKALLTMPVDFWWCVHRIVRYIRPSVFILVETDIWPGLINFLRNRGIRSILVNGRVSQRTFRSYQKFPLFIRIMFDGLNLCLMQSDLDRHRLLHVGIDPKKVRRVGNIKFDHDWISMTQQERNRFLHLLNLKPKSLIWVAGSTHEGEERILLEVFMQLRSSFPLLRFILAPRKIERSNDILRQALSTGLKSILRTELAKGQCIYDILILDTLGELRRIYGLAAVSFVGGSLMTFGGHNLLEPASFGCPVLFGPHTEDFRLMSELLIETGGGWCVKDGKELYEAMKTLLENTEMREKMGELAKGFVETNQGALERVISHIGKCVGRSGGLS